MLTPEREAEIRVILRTKGYAKRQEWWDSAATDLLAEIERLRVENEAMREEAKRLAEALRDADAHVSLAHDVVWATYPEWEGEQGRREPLNAALWKLHEILRAALVTEEPKGGEADDR